MNPEFEANGTNSASVGGRTRSIAIAERHHFAADLLNVCRSRHLRQQEIDDVQVSEST